MNKVLSSGLWAEIERLAKKSKVRRAAVAFVSSNALIRFGEGDTLIVNASNSAIASGETSAQVLADAFARGARLYSCPALHAKVMMFDDVAVIGSANASQSSAHSLVEAGLITNQQGIVADVFNFIDALKKKVSPIDDAFITRIQRIKVRRMGRTGRGTKRPDVKLPERRTWLISLWPYGKAEGQEAEQLEQKHGAEVRKEFKDPKSEIETYHFTDRSKFAREAKKGDSIICIWHERPWAEKRWGGKKRPPDGVYRHIQIVKRIKKKGSVWFFVEAFSDSEKDKVSWKQFLQIHKRTQSDKTIGPQSLRLLNEEDADKLNVLWDK